MKNFQKKGNRIQARDKSLVVQSLGSRHRITIDEVQVADGSLRLMKNVYWEYDKLPHMLIAGGTMERSEVMKLMDDYKMWENYAYLGLPPHFLIFDEYVAFM